MVSVTLISGPGGFWPRLDWLRLVRKAGFGLGWIWLRPVSSPGGFWPRLDQLRLVRKAGFGLGWIWLRPVSSPGWFARLALAQAVFWPRLILVCCSF